LRLRHGLEALEVTDPERARGIRKRARDSMSRLGAEFPGNLKTGILADDEVSRERFEEFGNEEVCPALSPTTGECELYASRPMTCRVFGPPVRTEEGLGVCELCYEGASSEEIAACELMTGSEALEQTLNHDAERLTKTSGQTIIAFCLAGK
jgi:Fe-S-cluster containining protein